MWGQIIDTLNMAWYTYGPSITNYLSRTGQGIVNFASKTGQNIMIGASRVGQGILNVASKTSQSIITGASRIGQGVINVAAKTGQSFANAAAKGWQWASNTTSQVGQSLKNMFTNMSQSYSSAVQKYDDFILRVPQEDRDNLWGVVKKVVNDEYGTPLIYRLFGKDVFFQTESKQGQNNSPEIDVLRNSSQNSTYPIIVFGLPEIEERVHNSEQQLLQNFYLRQNLDDTLQNQETDSDQSIFGNVPLSFAGFSFPELSDLGNIPLLQSFKTPLSIYQDQLSLDYRSLLNPPVEGSMGSNSSKGTGNKIEINQTNNFDNVPLSPDELASMLKRHARYDLVDKRLVGASTK